MPSWIVHLGIPGFDPSTSSVGQARLKALDHARPIIIASLLDKIVAWFKLSRRARRVREDSFQRTDSVEHRVIFSGIWNDAMAKVR